MTVPMIPGAGMPAGGFQQQPGQGQQQPLHPTVPYGQPGAPPTVVLPPNQGQGQAPPFYPAGGQGSFNPQQQLPPAPQQPGQFQGQPQPQFQQQQQPQFQPQPQGTFGQQQQQPAPPQHGQGFAQPGARLDIQDNMILDGPNVPVELRGRTFGQVRQLYSALAADHLQRTGAARQQQGNGQQPPQQQQPQGQGAGQQQNPPDDETRRFWQSPAKFIRETVEQVTAPVIQRTMQTGIAEARAIAQQGIPDFQQLEGEMLNIMQGADPASLANPQLWASAADLARGRLMSRGQYDPRQVRPPMQAVVPQGPQFVPAPGGPGMAVPAPMVPMQGYQPQQPYQFFTEQPTPPGGMGQQSILTPEQRAYAGKMGMSEQQYIDWSGGIQKFQTQRRWGY